MIADRAVVVTVAIMLLVIEADSTVDGVAKIVFVIAVIAPDLLFFVCVNHETQDMPTSQVLFFIIYNTTEQNKSKPNKSKSRSNQSEASS